MPAPDQPAPRASARCFLEEQYGPLGSPSLRYWREDFWIWSENHYSVVSESNLRGFVSEWMADNNHPNRKSQVTEVLAQLMGMTQVLDTADMPIYIEDDHYDTTRNYLALRNCLMDMGALVYEGVRPLGQPFLQNTPRWFSPVALDFEYQLLAGCPLWEAELDKLTGSDKAMVALLQEWFGLCLTTETAYKKMVILYGDTNTGKSTIQGVLEALVGPANRSAVPLELFNSQFALWETIGRLVNVCGDADHITRLAEGVLKRVTGGDTIRIDRKFKQPVEVKMTAKIFVATNNFPQISDSSRAMWERIIVIPLTREIPESEIDHRYLDPARPDWPFRSELPGIFNWAVDGLRRLKKQGCFTEAQACKQAKATLWKENSSAILFLEEHCECPEFTPRPPAKAPTTMCSDLMREYHDWCQTNGYHMLSDSEMGKAVRNLFPKVEKKRLLVQAGQKSHYVGLRMHTVG